MSLPLPAPEVQLLFLLLNEGPPPGEARALIDAGIDWPLFCWLVGKEKAGSVAYRRLRALLAGEIPAGEIPEEALISLKRQEVVTAFRMARLEERLDETLEALRAAGIEVILLKGAGLASTIYASFGDRPMSDLDLLVRADQGGAAWEVAQAAGWKRDLEAGSDQFYIGHQHYPPLIDGSGTGFYLEVHTGLLEEGHPFDLPFDDLWASAVPVPARGDGVFVLERSAQVLHLCLHFAWSHTMGSGLWRTARDLDRIAAVGGIDWVEFESLALRSRAATCAYWTLRLARLLAGLDVPGSTLDRLAPPGSELWLRWLERHYISNLMPGAGRTCPSDRVRYGAWEAGIRPGWSGHGDRRPWDRNATFLDDAGTAEGQGAAMRPRNPLWGQVARYREWVRYLGLVSGLSSRTWSPGAASRRATLSKRGRSASISSGMTFPSR